MRKGLNKISNQQEVAADSMVVVAADSNRAAAAAAHNLAADMLAGDSNNLEQFEMALRDFGDIVLAENFPHQILGGRRDKDLYSNKKSQKIKFQQQAIELENYAL